MGFRIMLFLLGLVALGCNETSEPQSADNDWVKLPTAEWPQIAMINEVWYQDSQRYVHPSFDYAGTGFLIRDDDRVLAATAKHVLWIAKHDRMRSVDPNPYLEKWIMRPKGNMTDSVVLGKMINADTTEILQGRGSTVQQRDWIVFETRSVPDNIQVLTPDYRQLKPGERLYYSACPYNDPACIVASATVLTARGNRIVFTQDDSTANVGGASGSPLIDTAGYVVGILGGSSVNPRTGGPAMYGISTHYLKKVLTNDPDKNIPLTSIIDHLKTEIATYGFEQAIIRCQDLVTQPDAYFHYSMSPEEFNSLAREYMDNGQPKQAVYILNLSLEVHPNFSRTLGTLGTAYMQYGRPAEARRAFAQALKFWPENEEAKKGLAEAR